MIAARMADMPKHRPKESASIDALTQPEAAELLGVSRPSVQRAKQVIESGDDELIAILSGNPDRQTTANRFTRCMFVAISKKQCLDNELCKGPLYVTIGRLRYGIP